MISSALKQDFITVLHAPERVLRRYLADAPLPALHVVITAVVVPAACIRPVAVLLRSLLLHAPVAAVILALGSLVLQIGTWLVVGLAMPPVARSFKLDLDERQSLIIVAFASVPLWLAGALYAVPEGESFLFYWSRSVICGLALFGLYIAYRALAVLEAPRESRLPALAAMLGCYLGVYVVLFTLIGLLSHIALWIFGASV